MRCRLLALCAKVTLQKKLSPKIGVLVVDRDVVKYLLCVFVCSSGSRRRT